MPLQTITKVAELVPAAGALIKRASFEKHFPTTSRDETLLSALELEYMIKVAHTKVDLDDAERVCRAVDLYGLADEVRTHSGTMVKSASIMRDNAREVQSQITQAERFIDTQLMSSNPNMEKVAEASEHLWDEYSTMVESDSVKLYAGAGTLVKEAAVLALQHRAKRTGNQEFEKIAQVIDATNPSMLSVDDNRAIINAIRGLEKAAHYTESDLYKDMFHTKKAACMVKLGIKSVDATDLVGVAGHVGSILGADIGKLLLDAAQNAAAIEALPLGERQVIAGLV